MDPRTIFRSKWRSAPKGAKLYWVWDERVEVVTDQPTDPPAHEFVQVAKPVTDREILKLAGRIKRGNSFE